MSTEGVRERVDDCLALLLHSNTIAVRVDDSGQHLYSVPDGALPISLPRKASNDPSWVPTSQDLVLYYLYMHTTGRQSQIFDFAEQQLGSWNFPTMTPIIALDRMLEAKLIEYEDCESPYDENPVYRLPRAVSNAIHYGAIILMIPKTWQVMRTVLCDQPLETRYEIVERRDAEIASSLTCNSLKEAEEQIHQGEIKDKKQRNEQLHRMFSYYMKEFEHGLYRGMEIRSATTLVSTMTDPSLVLKEQETAILQSDEFLSWKAGVTLEDIDEREAQGKKAIRVIHSFISAPRRVEELVGANGVIGLYGTIYALVVW